MNPKRSQGKIIQINEHLVRSELGEVVRETVEETLNKLLDAEADKLCKARNMNEAKHELERVPATTRGNCTPKPGEVELAVPKLRGVLFETAIIERYKRRECSVEEALIEMYLPGVSVRRVEDSTEALWGPGVSAGTISNLNKQL